MVEILHRPNLGILNRDLAIVESKALFDEYSAYLEELCNFASNALVRCEKSLKGIKGTPATLIFLYFHIIQMSDGVQVLCSRASYDTAVLLLRSLWEATLSVEFIVESDFEKRSTAWLASCYLKRKRSDELLRSIDGKKSKFELMQENDKVHRDTKFTLPDQMQLAKQLEQYDKMFEKQKFQEALELLGKNRGNKKVKKWYAIDGGPNNLKELADHLEHPIEYEKIYKAFSDVSHGQDPGSAIEGIDGKQYLSPMRSDKNSILVYSMTSNYLTIATNLVVNKIRPDEDILKSIQEIRKRHGRPV